MKHYTIRIQLMRCNRDWSDDKEVISRQVIMNAKSDESAISMAKLLWTLAESILNYFHP